MNYLRTDIKLIAIFVLIGFLIGPRIFAKQLIDTNIKDAPESTRLATNTDKQNFFEHMSLEAESAYIFDIKTQQVIFSKNPDRVRPLASITKMMTAIVAAETAPINSQVTLMENDLDTEGESGLLRSEHWRLDDLIAYTLINSSNDGAAAIAASVGESIKSGEQNRNESRNLFVDKMNKKAQYLGLTSLYFTNPTGLDNEQVYGGRGNARDVARLFEYALKKHSDVLQYTALPNISITSVENVKHQTQNTNEIASITPGIIGGKTGYTDQAGGNLAMVVDIGIQRPVVLVVLGSTKEERFTDMEKLLSATKKTIIEI